MDRSDDQWRPSDLPEVVPRSYPEAHAYIRPRNEPGEMDPKYIAYDQTGMEVVEDKPMSPTSPHDIETPVTPKIDAPTQEEPPPEENRPRTICGFAARTFWIVLVVSIVVIAAAIGGGVGGGIAASKAQHDSQITSSSSASRHVLLIAHHEHNKLTCF
jgi:hypothetical protein